MISYIGNGLV